MIDDHKYSYLIGNKKRIKIKNTKKKKISRSHNRIVADLI